jgi:hypothetical protein
MPFDLRKGRAAALVLIAGLILSACTSRVIPPMTFGRAPGERPAANLSVKMAFVPVTGAPSEPVARLNVAIKQEAARRNITIVQPGDPTADYTVKGYLSAVGGTSGTVFVFVWDIADRSGARVHRVSGQESSARGAPDPWAAVDDDTLNLVALRTVDSIAAWLRRT